jgi:hypothetical protein
MSEWFDTFNAPKPAPDPYEEAAAEPATPEIDEELDPRAAAAILAQTTERAERELDRRPTFLMLVAAGVVLIVYGALWISVRHQHPYSGPTGWALGVLYGTLAVWIAFYLAVRTRATSGVSGRAMRQGRFEGLTFATVWVFVYVFQGALHHAGASDAIAYGIYPAAAPLLIIGGAAAVHQAARQNWPWAGFALGAVVLGGLASYAGPRAVWGIVGVGLFVLLIARAAQTWLTRR